MDIPNDMASRILYVVHGELTSRYGEYKRSVNIKRVGKSLYLVDVCTRHTMCPEHSYSFVVNFEFSRVRLTKEDEWNIRQEGTLPFSDGYVKGLLDCLAGAVGKERWITGDVDGFLHSYASVRRGKLGRIVRWFVSRGMERLFNFNERKAVQ